MGNEFSITKNDRLILRELAKKYRLYAGLPVMEERKKLWYRHNSLKSEKPVIVMEIDSFADELLPPLQCETPAAREIEFNLLKYIVNHELINDDKVIPPYYTVYWKIILKEFDAVREVRYAEDGRGKKVGYEWQHLIKDLQQDLKHIKPSVFAVDREYTADCKSFIEDIIGDLIPVRIKNKSLFWCIAPSMKAVFLMGLERMMFSMVDYPEEMHLLYDFLKKDIMAFVKWQEKERLLTLNNENDYTGAGSYGFTTELPSAGFKDGGIVTTKDLWVNMNSQETVGISPDMFKEFIFPYYYDLAKEFGLTYFGCCEPVHAIWENCISKLPGLRKVSVSAWCDEEYMGNALMGSNVIYSRKPSPNFVGVGSFDEKAFGHHILKTLNAAKNGHLEFLFKDIYTLSGDLSKPGKAVEITRQLIEKHWQQR